MINVKDEVYDAIKDVCDNVGDTHPKTIEELPTVQYTEEENKVYEWIDDKEVSSYVRYRIDIWAVASTSLLALAVDERMSKLGLKRTMCSDADDSNGTKHKIMRYEGVIDNATEFINHI